MTFSEFSSTVAAQITTLLARACPDTEQPGLLIALSGGPDSIALLRAAHAWSAAGGGILAAAHLNHGLRGDDAEQDESFCRDLCTRLQVRLIVGRDDPRPVARARGGGLEEAARVLRRRFLESVLDSEPALHAVATGHHRDDQAETVLMRLLQGTGPDGMRGIRPVSGRFIHPLLGVSRAEIVAVLTEVGQPWREDVTNAGGNNLRARLRRELLPVMRGIFGKGSDEGPAQLARLLDEELELLDELTREAERACGDADTLDVAELGRLPAPLLRRVMRRWLGRAATGTDGVAALQRIGRPHVEAVLGLLADGASGAGVDLPQGLRVVREFGQLKVAQAGAAAVRRAEDYRVRVADGGTVPVPGGEGHGDPDDEATWTLTCPTSALQGNVRVRNWRRGDRMDPLGLDGSKKLSDLLRERRVPASARPNVLVVEDDAGILWVVGVARAERTRLLPAGGPSVTLAVARRRSPKNRGKDT